MMIGLCVDYGIQGVSRHREALADGVTPDNAMSAAIGSLMLPLGLAGGTTIISFLTNLLGDIGGLADFGIVAALGVASGLFLFLTFVPAAKVLIERHTVAKGKPVVTAQLSDAIPGAGALVERIGTAAVKRPAALLIVTGVVTVILAFFAANLESSFKTTDFLPRGSGRPPVPTGRPRRQQ
jgi:uncharacterized membrane protein YdfJ with MMPL/SSD domain